MQLDAPDPFDQFDSMQPLKSKGRSKSKDRKSKRSMRVGRKRVDDSTAEEKCLKPKTDSGYRPDIDGLRAVAVTAVVAYHMNHSWVPGGFVGVDIFFVVSGFVVSGSLLRNQSSSVSSFLVAFYARRVKRLTPSLACCILVTSIVVSVLLDPAAATALKDYYFSAMFGLVGWARLEIELAKAYKYVSGARCANPPLPSPMPCLCARHRYIAVQLHAAYMLHATCTYVCCKLHTYAASYMLHATCCIPHPHRLHRLITTPVGIPLLHVGEQPFCGPGHSLFRGRPGSSTGDEPIHASVVPWCGGTVLLFVSTTCGSRIRRACRTWEHSLLPGCVPASLPSHRASRGELPAVGWDVMRTVILRAAACLLPTPQPFLAADDRRNHLRTAGTCNTWVA